MQTKKSSENDAKISSAINQLLEQALARGASDVHFEPRDRNVLVRFRIDGWMEQVSKLPLIHYTAITNDLKKRAGLKTSTTSAPQSGTTEFDAKQRSATIVINTMPTIAGEKVVIHLTPRLTEPATLESLGFWGKNLTNIEHAIVEPHGLVVASSPLHTGASMTLLGMIHLLDNPALNIATLEEPITQRVSNINQTEVRPQTGISFNTYFQALLKQDPNVVMISNLRGEATVATALEAALSGRLILGATHNNSAVQAIEQLQRSCNEPFLIASALRLVVGQRYVRRLCPVCRIARTPDSTYREELKMLLKYSGLTSITKVHELEKEAAQAQLGLDTTHTPLPLATTDTRITTFYSASEHGCEHCSFKGYTGRIGICEVLPMSDHIRKQIAARAGANDIYTQALTDGMIPLQLDGFIKALRGLTTIEEVLPLMISMPHPIA